MMMTPIVFPSNAVRPTRLTYAVLTIAILCLMAACTKIYRIQSMIGDLDAQSASSEKTVLVAKPTMVASIPDPSEKRIAKAAQWLTLSWDKVLDKVERARPVGVIVLEANFNGEFRTIAITSRSESVHYAHEFHEALAAQGFKSVKTLSITSSNEGEQKGFKSILSIQWEPTDAR
jgi:hypothetical protein